MADEITVGGIAVPLTHPGKVLFPADGITKADLARYYADVADRMLPWLRDRPISMVRYPDGLDGQRFFQKNVPAYFPDPDAITTEQRKDKREMRIYADVMRNAYAQTVVACYGVRARPGAPVATPLTWAEVEDDGLQPGQFTMATIRARLDGDTDPWVDFTGSRHGLGEAGHRLANLDA